LIAVAPAAKPLPEITEESRPFWEACRRHQLLIQRCRACGARQYYPRGICAHCWGPDLEWEPSAGRGTVYTFTVVHRSQAPGFKDSLPYVLAYVELEEGVQVLTNLVGCDPATARIGLPVRVTFEDVSPEVSIPRFAPAASRPSPPPGETAG
jgi:uncharacterized OB-fold protein